MTTMAAMFGALPLAIGNGDGRSCAARSHRRGRRPAPQPAVDSVYDPVMYLYLDRFRLWAKSRLPALFEPTR